MDILYMKDIRIMDINHIMIMDIVDMKDILIMENIKRRNMMDITMMDMESLITVTKECRMTLGTRIPLITVMKDRRKYLWKLTMRSTMESS